MDQDALRISNLHRHYCEGHLTHRVICGAELRLERGECAALLGRSGSGKSTLLNLIAGIDKPDSGKISIDGTDVSHLREPELTRFRRRQIGFIYQFFNLIPTLTAAENVALPLELNGHSRSEVAERSHQMLKTVGLDARHDAFPDQLSGGEQQRIAIARALVHRPPLILADEPTGNLDQETGERVLRQMLGLAREEGSSILLVTHSLSVAGSADRTLTLDQGVLTQGGSALAW